jgi:hypothetical protein
LEKQRRLHTWSAIVRFAPQKRKLLRGGCDFR